MKFYLWIKTVITYRKAKLSDIDFMQRLVFPEIEAGVILARSDNEVATNIRSYTLAFDDDRLIGFVALHIHTIELAEVRSLIVDRDYRGKEVGSTLVGSTLQEAQNLGIKKVLSLTYKQRFFENLGFVVIPKESIPETKIWADCIKCKHFPLCNEISLIKTL